MEFSFRLENIFFSESCIENFAKTFNGGWSSGGPKLFQYVYHKICSKEPEVCSGVTLTPSKYFFPLPWYEATLLMTKKSSTVWDHMFKDSYTVHLYQSSTNHNKLKKIHQVKYFGKEMPALTYLSQSHCPLTLKSQ